MLNNLPRALIGLFMCAAMTACVGDDSGSTDSETTDPSSTTEANTGSTTESSTTESSTGSTSETDGTTTDATTTDSTDTMVMTTDGTTTDGTTTDVTTTTTDGTTTDATTTTTTTDGTTTTTTTDGDMGFAAEVYPIIAANCSCHVGGAPAGLAMPDADTAFSNLVDVDAGQAMRKRVAPGMPGMSYLVNKIEGTHLDVGGSGGQMPKGGPPLAPADVMVIKDWIADGAMP